MALIDTATLVPDSGNFFLAVVGSALPANLAAPAAPWGNIGHTSVENMLGFESEGGETTILSTLQNKALRTKRANVTDTLSLTLQQFDRASLKLYFGDNASDGDYVTGTTGRKWLRISGTPTPTTTALLIVFVDGENLFALHIPKCEILRGDAPDFGDGENLAGLPLKITPLQLGANNWTIQVTPLGTV